MAGTTPTAQAQSNYQPSYSADTYNPAQATGELQQAAGYQDQQQNANLMSMLAAQGISPGSSAAQAADQNLSYGQSAALDPSLAGVQQYAGGLGVQNNQFNSGAFNTAELTQAGAQNQDWLAELEGMLGLQGEGLGTAGSLAGAQAGQQVPMNPSIWSQISQGVEGAGQAAAPFMGA